MNTETGTDTSAIDLEWSDCPLCGSDRRETLWIGRDRLLGRPGEFPVVQCLECSFVYLYPRPAPESLSSFYPDDYFPLQAGAESPEAIAEAEGLLRRVQGWCARNDKTNTNVLDLGCGTGLFLKMARDAGFQVQGVEMSASAVAVARQVYGLPVEQGDIGSVELPAESFDVVTMWHVLEHLPEPVTALRRVHRLLNPGGLLLFALPNIDSYEARTYRRRWYSLDAPRHLGHFSPATAERAVTDAGFRLERIDHSASTAGLVYSAIGDLTGVSLKLRGRDFSEQTYHRLAGLIRVPAWPLCKLAARLGRGGAIVTYARRPG
jgi:SAM-dependent methyltransferase